MATQPDRSYFFSSPAAQPTSRCIAGRHNVALRQQFECHPWRSCDVSKGQLTRRSNTLRVAPGTPRIWWTPEKCDRWNEGSVTNLIYSFSWANRINRAYQRRESTSTPVAALS